MNKLARAVDFRWTTARAQAAMAAPTGCTGLASLVFVVAAVCAPFVQAQPVIPSTLSSPPQLKLPAPSKPATAGAASTAAAQKSEAKPTWQELTPTQQQSLKPLAANWSSIGEGQKRKWLALSKNYTSLSAPEQAKIHSRMTEWVSLSQDQRTQARLNFAETKTLSPSEKSANWQAYQALSPEDRQKLTANATPKPAGAAAAVKPVAPQKLAPVPLTRQSTKLAAEGQSGGRSVDQNTLLPRAPSPSDAVQKN